MYQRRKSIFSRLVSFVAIASLILGPQTFAARAAGVQLPHPLYRTLAERVYSCLHADYRRMADAHDYPGLLTWVNDCYDARRNNAGTMEQKSQFVEFWAMGKIYLARYFHDYPRQAPWGNHVASIQTNDDMDPNVHMNGVRRRLGEFERSGVNTFRIRGMLAGAENYLRTPSRGGYDTSIGTSCVLDGMPADNNANMIRKIETCMTAYNQRPLAVFALNYGIAIINFVRVRPLHYESNLVGLSIAKEFLTRAKNEGSGPADFALKVAEEGIDHFKWRLTLEGLIERLPAIALIVAACVYAVGITASGGIVASKVTTAAGATGGVSEEVLFYFLQAQRAAIPLVP